jgi:tetratricopeptide (TPR) repeat protein
MIMRNWITLLLLMTGLFAWSQQADLDFEKQKLKQALAYSDDGIAISSMYNIIALEGPQSTYKDSLAYLYFNARNYVSCFLVTNDALSHRPGNSDLMEMKAVSLESMGALEKAMEAYEELLVTSNSNYHAYKIAGLQFGMKKHDEALASIKQAASLPDTGELQVNFQVNQNYNQNVPLKAAIPYLEGLINLALERESDARDSFNKALGLFPDFVLAKSKLEVLKVPE